ncbi:conserved hypothetical protein [Candidatus Nitrotoga sp. 1052]|nr:conserved hypothetical protein [Candidatus Nitrotoga sp. 1052]
MNDQMSTSEAGILAEMKRYWAESHRFYSNPGKEDRERWVVEEFLNCLSVPFTNDELQSHPQYSKVDIEFRQARFQIKEIPNPNFRRGDEIKDTYRRVMEAKTLQDTVGPGFVYEVPPVVSGYGLVRDNAHKLAFEEKYIDCKANIDLLFYITRTRASIVEMKDVKIEELSPLGWRSVSCLMGSRALVLYATLEAPAFLHTAL